MTVPGPKNADAAETIRERYVVTGTLGSGSQGETFEAVDKREGRPVAIKRFQIRGAKSWKDVELAEREATVLSALSHPSLPPYVEHFEEGGALYLVMGKIEGESLAARRRRGASLDQEQVLRFLREAGSTLAYLHAQAPPVVHRDIKPGNVILRPDGSYALVDFGSVRDRLKPEGGSTVVGTFGFMAPEQFQGRAGPASDVYAVAATAISLLTGREPEDLPHKGLAIDVEAALRGHADQRLIGALRAMLEPDPDRRPSSVEAALVEAEPRKRHQGRDERPFERFEQKVREKADRKARKAAERAVRRAERHARRHGEWHRPGRPVPPGVVLGTFLLIVFQIARVATFALFQVLLPTLFTLLTVVGGRNMHQRGRRMIEIGKAGQRGLTRAGEHIRYQFMGGPAPAEHEAEAQVEPAPARRARVAIDAELEEAEAEAEELLRRRG
ncbi:MAG TPA: serine/threonine-protein kinase [Polyangiaceae bacterium]|nr:serine/threonine-protein kinase [Polyangiaceae bacterium]